MPSQEQRSITLTTSAILKVLAVLAVLWFVYLIRDVITIVFIAFVLAAAVSPWVDKLQKRFRFPRVVSVVSIAVVVFGLLSIAIVILIPALINDIRSLASKLPELYSTLAGKLFAIDAAPDRAQALATLERNLQALSEGLLQLTGGLLGTLSSIFGGFASFLTVLVISFFMTVEENGMRKLLQSLAPEKYRPYIAQLINKIETRLGNWLRGQLFLSIIIAILTYIGLSLLGIRYALVLALLAGFFEIIPFIGPVIAALPAIFFAATVSPLTVGLTVGLYLVIQQLENNLLVPKVMQQTVGLHPILILIALLIGARIGGVIGIIMAVPVVIILSIFAEDIFEDRRVKPTPSDSKSP